MSTQIHPPKYQTPMGSSRPSSSLAERHREGHLYSSLQKDDFLLEQSSMTLQISTLLWRHALLVLGEKRLWRKFKLPCLNLDSCYPEEHYFPTLLSMKDPKGCSHYTLTNVNWTGSVDGHPYFKFAPDCLQPLMDIADVIFRD
ncbi:hypothetical protein Tsubulata_041100 [Turnera subulata]|uniref:Uncharacterized protein n=1 Tax=Turnera subulata TaxID=218843 RepID=A0A9Q0J573_9ROSI|nr:hypothetical protein Tsubulata_041100 [Turnera subulata]